MVAPLQPSALSVDLASSSQTQISVVMSALAGTDTGGSPILSYSLEYDAGTSGASFTILTGYSSFTTALTFTQTGLTSGSLYQFRYRAYNSFGWSPYSDITNQLAAAKPATPDAPITTNTGVSVRIAWTAPIAQGSTISAYTIEIQHVDGSTYSINTDYCNGSTSTIVANLYCVIPVSTLTASPFSLEQGDIVYARVMATNAIGDSSVSDVNSSGADIRVVPTTPTSPPSRGSSTSDTEIEV